MEVITTGIDHGILNTHLTPMEYRHVCVVMADQAQLYLGGRLRGQYALQDRVANRTLEAVLVLGQDQDKPGGGFDSEYSFAGAIVDFHLFGRVMTPAEILAMAKCGAPPRGAVVTQANAWLRNNISVSFIKRQELCSEGTEFFMFQRVTMPEQVAELCNRLQGYIPAADDVAAMLKSLRKYFEDQSDFTKVYIPVNTAPVNTSEELFKSLRIIWDNGDYYDATPTPSEGDLTHHNLVCSIKEGSILKLHGLPGKMKNVLDSDYFLYFAEGKHFLRGIQKSLIKQHNDPMSWCLALRQDPSSPVLCTHTSSDFPPVGRMFWTGSDNATHRLNLSGCRLGEFTCDSGSCISLSSRCDSRNDCEDKTDENNCEVLRVNSEQRLSLATVPFSPVQIQAELELSDLQEINHADNNFVAALWLSLSWTDDRLDFFNLPLNTSRAAKVPGNMMWTPEIVLYPIKTGGQARLVIVEAWSTCEGKPSMYDVWEGECLLSLSLLSPSLGLSLELSLSFPSVGSRGW